MTNEKTKLGFLFLTCAQLMVALNIIVSKILLETIPVSAVLTIRFFLAFIILLPLHWLKLNNTYKLRKNFKALKVHDWLFMLAQGLCAGIMFNYLMLIGLKLTDANIAGIITSVLPAMIAIMSWLILKETITWQKGLSVAFACAGLAIIAMDKLSSIVHANSFLGDFIVLLALIPEATYYILCRFYSFKLPVFITAALLNGFNVIVLIPSWYLSDWQISNLSSHLIMMLIISGISSGLFYVFWFIGAKHVDGVLSSLSTAIMPVATVIFAWAILGENLSSIEISGMCLVLFSIYLYARR